MRKLYVWLSLLIGIGLFWFVIDTVSWTEAIKVIAAANVEYLTVYVVTSVVIRLLLAWRWHVVLKAKGVFIPYYKAFLYKQAGFAVSFVTPGPRVGGEAITAGLVTRHSDTRTPVRMSKALSTVLLDKAVELQTFATMFFGGVLLLSFAGEIPRPLQAILLASSLLFLLVIALFGLNLAFGKPFLTRIAKRMSASKQFRADVEHFEEAVTSFYRTDRRHFVQSHAVAVAAWLLSLLEYKYLLLLLGFDVPLYVIFIIYSSVGIAYLLPIPLALGTLESTQAASFSLVGLPVAAGFVLAFLTRLRDIGFAIIGFMILGYYGIAPRHPQKKH